MDFMQLASGVTPMPEAQIMTSSYSPMCWVGAEHGP